MTDSPGSVADEIAKFAALRDEGVITEDEFAAQRARLLGPPTSGAPLPEAQDGLDATQAQEGEPPAIAGMPPRNEGSSGMIALVVAILIPIAGIILGGIGLKKARTQRDKVLSGVALGFGIAWIAAVGMTVLISQSSSTSAASASPTAAFTSQSALQDAMTAKAQAKLASASATASDTIAPFVCTGPIGATSSQETWSCSTTLSNSVASIPETVSVTAYPDGSWISRRQ
jgi:hypothetical protein